MHAEKLWRTGTLSKNMPHVGAPIGDMEFGDDGDSNNPPLPSIDADLTDEEVEVLLEELSEEPEPEF